MQLRILKPRVWPVLALAVAIGWSALAQDAAPPPSGPPLRSATDLQKLVEPIALYPDPLISIILPAAAYPLEIVQAARFVRDPNNVSQVDSQPWDQNVKSVAKIPQVISMLDSNLTWTSDLGQAFVDQPSDVMDAIQVMRGMAHSAGTLQTTPQQVVVVTNVVIVQTNVTQVVTVTNQVVEIYPSNPQVVYVPTYPPTVYYPPPAYVYNPLAPLVTFGVGVAVGAIIANNCNWYHGGGGIYVGNRGVVAWGHGSSYYGGYRGGGNTVNIYNNNSRNVNVNNSRNTVNNNMQKWQPDQNRMRTSGGGSAYTRTSEARGWGSGQGSAGNIGTRPSTGNVATRPATGNVGTRPSTGNVGTRPSTGTGNFGGQPSQGAAANRPSTGNVANRPNTTAPASRPAPATSNFQSKPAASPSRSPSSNSAFSGVNSGSAARYEGNRGAASRSSGSYGGSRGGGGARRGGGGGRR